MGITYTLPTQVVQYQYTSWPDHGVPRDILPVSTIIITSASAIITTNIIITIITHAIIIVIVILNLLHDNCLYIN